MKASTRLILSVALVLVVLGCKRRSYNQNARTLHAEGEFVRGIQNPLNWAPINEADFYSNESNLLRQNLMAQKSIHLPQDHPTTKRLNRWLQKVDSILRAKNIGQMDSTPVPYVIIVNDSTPNAYLSASYRCLKTTVKIVNSAATVEKLYSKLESIVNIDHSRGMRFDSDYKEMPCEEFEQDKAQDLVKGLQESYPECNAQQVNSEGDSGIQLDAKCLENQKYPVPLTITRIKWTAPNNSIVVTKGLLETVRSESEMVTLLSHEMAHFYRAHESSLLPKIGHFYEESQYKKKGMPEQSPKMKYLEDSYHKLSFPIRLPAAVNSSQLPRSVQYQITSLGWHFLENMCSRESGEICKKECEPLKTPFDPAFEGQGGNATAEDAQVPPTAAFLLEFGKKESNLKTCLSAYNLKVPAEYNQFMRYILNNPSLAVANQRAVTLGTAWERFIELKPIVEQLAKDKIEMQLQIIENASGDRAFYTFEQEADDWAMEMINELGIDTCNTTDVFLSLYFKVDQLSGPSKNKDAQAITAEQCYELRKNGFKDLNGKTIVPNLGNLKDPHHDQCYRIFNLEQERKHRHCYVLKNAQEIPFLSTEDWQKLATLKKTDFVLP